MQLISLIELLYASYTDIRYLEAEPLLILGFSMARVAELILEGENICGYLNLSAIVFLIFIIICTLFSVGGADALIAVLICLNLGFYGIVTIITGLLTAVPFVLLRKGRETPLIPFLSIGYVIWLSVINICL